MVLIIAGLSLVLLALIALGSPNARWLALAALVGGCLVLVFGLMGYFPR